MQRAYCGKFGKQFTNKKGVKQHMLRMHINKTKKVEEISNDQETVTLEEETNPHPQKTGNIAKEKRQKVMKVRTGLNSFKGF